MHRHLGLEQTPDSWEDILEIDTHEDESPMNVPVTHKSNLRYWDKFKVWALPALRHKIAILGTSNLSRIATIPDADVTVHSFPGAHIAHLESLLKNYSHDAAPEVILIAIGVNDRANHLSSSITNMRRLKEAAMKTFPNSKVYISRMIFSDSTCGSRE